MQVLGCGQVGLALARYRQLAITSLSSASLAALSLRLFNFIERTCENAFMFFTGFFAGLHAYTGGELEWSQPS